MASTEVGSTLTQHGSSVGGHSFQKNCDHQKFLTHFRSLFRGSNKCFGLRKADFGGVIEVTFGPSTTLSASKCDDKSQPKKKLWPPNFDLDFDLQDDLRFEWDLDFRIPQVE